MLLSRGQLTSKPKSQFYDAIFGVNVTKLQLKQIPDLENPTYTKKNNSISTKWTGTVHICPTCEVSDLCESNLGEFDCSS